MTDCQYYCVGMIIQCYQELGLLKAEDVNLFFNLLVDQIET